MVLVDNTLINQNLYYYEKTFTFILGSTNDAVYGLYAV